uniref:virulence RhuM family protein n=1 Tax=Yunchengibacter salinarum TaxID=3133399 RepID=UPI0035B594FC
MSDIVIYTTEDGKNRIELRVEGGTVWLTQQDIADLFATTKQNVSLHIANILEDGELHSAATVKESLTVQTEGERRVERNRRVYNLDMILAVGYRVRSPRGVQFRRWASTVLSEYLIKGFAMDDARLKQPDFDYFVSASWAPRVFQLDVWKFQGRRSSMRFLGCPPAIASSVAL